jgi:transposase
VSSDSTTYVGVDAHQRHLQVAMLLPGQSEPERWQVENEPQAIRRLAKKLQQQAPGAVEMCYEAGPGGFALMRSMEGQGVHCTVIAPALIPQRAGDRVKTDRRDADKLARLLRADLLTAVHPPTPEQEAVRDLCRAREDLQADRKRNQHRLSKMLLRYGLAYTGGTTAWTLTYRRWLGTLHFEYPTAQTAFDDYLRAVDLADERVRGLDAAIAAAADAEPYREAVGILRCFHGVETYTALALLAELGDITRFPSARALMAFLGLTPSEHSSGEHRRRGSITKAGNSHARRLLVEAAWHQRHAPRVGQRLRQRRAGKPVWAVGIADRAHARLHRRYRHLVSTNKPANKAVTAVARELAGFLWAALQEQSRRQSTA